MQNNRENCPSLLLGGFLIFRFFVVDLYFFFCSYCKMVYEPDKPGKQDVSCHYFNCKYATACGTYAASEI